MGHSFAAINWLLITLGVLMLFDLWGFWQNSHPRRRKRTKPVTFGWGLWMQSRLGGFDEFSGVFIRRTRNRDTELGVVGLTRKSGGRLTPVLWQSYDSQKANALAEEMEKTLGLPRVAAPPPETMRDLLRRSSHV